MKCQTEMTECENGEMSSEQESNADPRAGQCSSLVGRMAEAAIGPSLSSLVWIWIAGLVLVIGSYMLMRNDGIASFWKVVAATVHFMTILVMSIVTTAKAIITFADIGCRRQ